LRITGQRVAAGTDWTTASVKFQHWVDATAMGYVEFNPTGGSLGSVGIGNASTEIMRISGNNSVGIGTVTPSYTCHIVSSTSGAATAVYHGSAMFAVDSLNNGELAIGWIGASPWTYFLQSRGPTATALPLALNPAGGSVGVGTVTPSASYKLDVAGTVHASSLWADSASPCLARMSVSGAYGQFWYLDTGSLFLLFTASGDPYGSWSAVRPLTIRASDGMITLGSVPVYASDSAAGTGGLTTGMLWKDSSGNLHIKI
jgi:hypothetical protein